MCSTPVGDPDDPELVIIADKGIFRYKLPVPCDHHLGRVDTLPLQDHFNGGWFLIEEPGAPVWQDQFHALWYYFAGGFLKHPGGGERGMVYHIGMVHTENPVMGRRSWFPNNAASRGAILQEIFHRKSDRD